jgi:hypothetical protein
MRPTGRKPEDSAEGCRSLAQADRARAATMTSGHMRAVVERSADAWSARARLLDRLQKDFTKRAVAARTANPRGMKMGDDVNG